MFKLSDLLNCYRRPAGEGLDLPGGAEPAQTEEHLRALRAEQSEADTINNGELEDIGNADLLADGNLDRPGAVTEPEKKKTHLEEREELMDALAAKRRRHTREEGGLPPEPGDIDNDDDDDIDVDGVGSLQLPVTAPGAQPAPVAEQKQGFYAAQDGSIRYRATVDGQVLDITAEEAQAAMMRQAEANRSSQANQPVQPAAQKQQVPVQREASADNVNAELTRLRQERRTALMDMYNGDETAIDRLDTLDAQIMDVSLKSVDVVGRMTEHTQKQNAARWSDQIAADEQTLLADPRYAAVTKNNAAWEMVVREAGRIMQETKAHLSGARPLSVMQQAADNMLLAMGGAPASQVAPTKEALTEGVRQQRKQQIGNTAVSAGAAPQIRSRTQQRAPVPDGGLTPQQQRAAAMAELRKAKGERD